MLIIEHHFLGNRIMGACSQAPHAAPGQTLMGTPPCQILADLLLKPPVGCLEPLTISPEGQGRIIIISFGNGNE